MKGLYSEYRIKDGFFVKTYDKGIPVNLVRDEYIKSRALYELSLRIGGFVFPEPLSFSGRTITLKEVKYSFDLAGCLFKHNNTIKRRDIPRLVSLMERIGSALGLVHENLFLYERQEFDISLPAQKKVFLYADFGLKSILIKEDKSEYSLVLVDPSFNLINNKVFLYGSFYYDLAYFIFQLKNLIPLKRRFFYEWKNTKAFIEAFIRGYSTCTGTSINQVLLNNYEEEIKKRYLTTLKNDIIGRAWKKIILNPPNYEQSPKKRIHCDIPTPWR